MPRPAPCRVFFFKVINAGGTDRPVVWHVNLKFTLDTFMPDDCQKVPLFHFIFFTLPHPELVEG